MSNKYIGQAVTRLDAHDKAMGRIKYTDDLCDVSSKFPLKRANLGEEKEDGRDKKHLIK